VPLIFVLIKIVHLVHVINGVVSTQQFLYFSPPPSPPTYSPLPQPIAPSPPTYSPPLLPGSARVLATQPTLYFSQYLGLIIAVMF